MLVSRASTTAFVQSSCPWQSSSCPLLIPALHLSLHPCRSTLINAGSLHSLAPLAPAHTRHASPHGHTSTRTGSGSSPCAHKSRRKSRCTLAQMWLQVSLSPQRFQYRLGEGVLIQAQIHSHCFSPTIHDSHTHRAPRHRERHSPPTTRAHSTARPWVRKMLGV